MSTPRRPRYDLALIGFGGVNRALAELIATRNDELENTLGFSLRVVAITDLRRGSLVRPDGVALDEILGRGTGDWDFSADEGGDLDPRNEEVIRGCTADIVAEATFTNPADGEPATSHVRWALESGKHVCTTNKGPVALHGRELTELAGQNGVAFEFEGSVMSGTPIIRFAKRMLGGAGLSGFEGILNGTSNYVLGRMEAGLSLDAAVSEAQRLGYAEADPTADLEGSDIRLKVVILAGQLLGATIAPTDVSCAGISSILEGDALRDTTAAARWKLIGSARRRDDGSVEAAVRPVRLPLEHPLAGISGATNAVSFTTDLLGAVMVSGPGAGRVETAYALLSDITAIHDAVTSGELSRETGLAAIGV